MPRELPIPAAAHLDEHSVELVRVWAASEDQHVSIETEMWEDPSSWGICLADLARHVARAYEQQHGLSRAETLSRIRAAFDEHWLDPDTTVTGSLIS